MDIYLPCAICYCYIFCETSFSELLHFI